MHIEFDTRWLGSANAPSLLVLSEHINATYYISFHYPFEELVREGKASFSAISAASIAKILSGSDRAATVDDLAADLIKEARPDLVVFSRFALPDGPGLAKAFRQRAIPVIYHIDDDLLHLPDDLGARVLGVHGRDAVVSARRALMETADIIYASTSYLAERLRREFPRTPVYSGIYASMLDQPEGLPKPAADRFVIGYMGSKGHVRDLALVEQALAGVLAKHAHVGFETFGSIPVPDSLARFGERVSASRVIRNYQEFLGELARKSWNLGIAPLRTDTFNMCKAPTKFIEYTSCGIPTAASDICVYRDVIDDGTTGRLVRDGEWEVALNQAVREPQSILAWSREAFKSCSRRFSLQTLKHQLVQLMDLGRKAGSSAT